MITPRRHKRKLYYPIGLISLVILPLLFISYVKKDPNAQIQKLIDISIVPQEYKEYLEYWKKDYDIDIPPDGHWNIFAFTNNEYNNSLTFKNLCYAVKLFNDCRDTVSGIEIKLNRKMPYNRFIQIIDMLGVENINLYFIINSDIWVPRFPRAHNIINQSSDVVINTIESIYIKSPLTMIERLRDSLISLKLLWQEDVIKIPVLIILIWILLFILNIIRVVNWRKPNNINRLNYLEQ